MHLDNKQGSENSPNSNNQENKAYLHCIKLLSKKDYSKHKLEQKLKDKKFTSCEIKEAIEQVTKKGYLREDYYAQARIKGLIHKGHPPQYIVQKLATERVYIEIGQVESIFSEYGISQEGQIEQLALKKLRSVNSQNPNAFEKIMRFLISKGHDYSRCNDIVRNCLSNQNSEHF